MLRSAMAGCAIALFAATLAQAQSAYPTRPVKIVVPTAPGGGADTIARIYAQHMTKTTGQQFYVENRPGAGNIIGIEQVARAEPDGHTLLLGAATITLNHVVYRKLPYDVLRDFAPVTQMVSVPNVLVAHPSMAPNTLREFIAVAKAKPGTINYASAGVGSNLHLAMELMKYMTGIDVVHVPYKGVGPAISDLLAGHVQTMVSNILSAKPHVTSGKLKAYAVTSIKRAAAMPDVPTADEAGLPKYEVLNWFGMFAPAGTPPEIVERLQAGAAAMMTGEEVKKRLSGEGAEPVASTPAAFTAFVKEEMQKWSDVGKAAKIQQTQ